MSGQIEPNSSGRSGPEGGPDVRELVQKLNSLVEGDQAAAQLIACGEAAIPAVGSFLLHGKPGVIYQPRLRAIEVLGALGAKKSLIEYLRSRKREPDPSVRMAEDAVENAAALELTRWRTEDVFDVLIGLAGSHLRPGVVEALGQFRRAEAIPYLLGGLEDDVCRSAAEEGLRSLGREAENELVAAARHAVPSVGDEHPSSLLRRRAAIGLLAELGPSAANWPLLQPLMDDRDPTVVAGAARIAASLGSEEDRVYAVNRLLAVLPDADWSVRLEIRESLSRLYPDGQAQIEEEIAKRKAQPLVLRVTDSVLMTLLAVSQGNPREKSTE